MSKCINVNKDDCIGCSICVNDCPHHAIILNDKKAEMVLQNCLECGHCVAICPKNAISMDGYDMNEVLEYDSDKFAVKSDSLLNSIKFRRSIRKYKKIDVASEMVEKIIEAGRFTPSGSNKQSIRYAVVEHPENNIEKDAVKTFLKLKMITDIVGRFVKLPYDTKKYKIGEGFFFHGAPAVILVISDDTVDAAMASTNMGTMAESLGLGVLYVGFFVIAAKMNRSIREKFKLKGKEKVVAAIAIGYSDIIYRRTVPRKAAQIDWIK